jgi:hypothetical protein
MGDGLFYIAAKAGAKGRQSADLRLMRWTGDAEKPFVPVTSPMPGGDRPPVTQAQ